VRSAASGPLYRLRGVIGGRERVIELVAGRHVAGSSLAANIHIPVLGVSARHAVLHASHAALRVEDLGSANGTFVDGIRVRQAEVPMGAELRLGPVRLSVHAIFTEQCQLAVVRQPVPPALEALVELLARDSDRDPAALGASSPGQAALWRTCLEGFQARLRAGRGDLAPALSFLGGTLLASGCCVVEWTGHGTHLVSAWGAQREHLAVADVALLLGRDACCVAYLESELPLSIAVSPRAPGVMLGLLVWGDFWGRLGSARLLQLLLRMITRARDSPRGHARDRSRREHTNPISTMTSGQPGDPGWHHARAA
jgi:hypothetical protein